MSERVQVLAVGALGIVAAATVVGGVVAALEGVSLDASIIAIGSAAAGALGGAVAFQR